MNRTATLTRLIKIVNASKCFQLQKACLSSDMGDFLQGNVWETDPELFEIIKKEKKRQLSGLEMIASENFTSLPVLQCLSSCLHNKYSEGLPGAR